MRSVTWLLLVLSSNAMAQDIHIKLEVDYAYDPIERPSVSLAPAVAMTVAAASVLTTLGIIYDELQQDCFGCRDGSRWTSDRRLAFTIVGSAAIGVAVTGLVMLIRRLILRR